MMNALGWQPLPDGKHFRCLVCNATMHYQYLAKHEDENRRHQQGLKYWTDPGNQDTNDPNISAQQSNSTDIPSRTDSSSRPVINTALNNFMNDFRAGRMDAEATPLPMPPPSDITPPPPGIDWSSSAFDDLTFSPSFGEQVVLNLAERFAQYNVDDGALGVDSDDDLQEDEGDREEHDDVPRAYLSYC